MTKSRLTREHWVAVARDALIASGVDEVKVDLLARRLKVTRGSFYWHFAHRDALLEAVLEDWVERNRDDIASMRLEQGDGADFQDLFRVWLGEDAGFPAFDIAVRVWARRSSEVGAMVRQIDSEWIALVQALFERGGMTPPESLVRARIIYFHQIGYYALSMEETLADRARLAPYYYSALTGMAAPDGMEQALLDLAGAAETGD